MTYNITMGDPSFLGIFQMINGIVPYSSAVVLLIVPFVILFFAMSRFVPKYAFASSSFTMGIIAILLIPTGIVSVMWCIAFITLAVVGFIWISME